MNYKICDNLSSDPCGRLLFAGQDVCSLAMCYGTPLYLMDGDRIRERCRTYREAALRAFGPGSRIMYASKAASFKYIYKLIAEEGLGADVVSCGELLTAAAAGFPLKDAVFHSCNKTDDDIECGIVKGVGLFVCDSIEELDSISRIARSANVCQHVLLRLTPGIDPHTFAAVSTGNVDSKFGFGIATGMAERALEHVLSLGNIKLDGFHCHMGSQIFDCDVFLRAADIMLEFIAGAKAKYGFVTEFLDLGGGIGVRYLYEQQAPDIGLFLDVLGKHMKETCRRLGIDLPAVGLEPGRSLVADAGLTVYSVGSVKTIPDYRTYVTVDGGMTDNIRYALYNAPYTVVFPSDLTADCTMKCSLVGRCCESGDIIQPDIFMPGSVHRGDYVAVLTTGAYNYSMASNYNRIPRPPVVMLEGGESFVAVRRETFHDVFALDM